LHGVLFHLTLPLPPPLCASLFDEVFRC
jgi:hypothetical protein